MEMRSRRLEREEEELGHAGHSGQSASEVLLEPLKSCVFFILIY